MPSALPSLSARNRWCTLGQMCCFQACFTRETRKESLKMMVLCLPTCSEAMIPRYAFPIPPHAHACSLAFLRAHDLSLPLHACRIADVCTSHAFAIPPIASQRRRYPAPASLLALFHSPWSDGSLSAARGGQFHVHYRCWVGPRWVIISNKSQRGLGHAWSIERAQASQGSCGAISSIVRDRIYLVEIMQQLKRAVDLCLHWSRPSLACPFCHHPCTHFHLILADCLERGDSLRACMALLS